METAATRRTRRTHQAEAESPTASTPRPRARGGAGRGRGKAAAARGRGRGRAGGRGPTTRAEPGDARAARGRRGRDRGGAAAPDLSALPRTINRARVPEPPQATAEVIPVSPGEVVGKEVWVLFELGEESAGEGEDEGGRTSAEARAGEGEGRAEDGERQPTAAGPPDSGPFAFFRGTVTTLLGSERTPRHHVEFFEDDDEDDFDLAHEVVLWGGGVVTAQGAKWPVAAPAAGVGSQSGAKEEGGGGKGGKTAEEMGASIGGEADEMASPPEACGGPTAGPLGATTDGDDDEDRAVAAIEDREQSAAERVLDESAADRAARGAAVGGAGSAEGPEPRAAPTPSTAPAEPALATARDTPDGGTPGIKRARSAGPGVTDAGAVGTPSAPEGDSKRPKLEDAGKGGPDAPGAASTPSTAKPAPPPGVSRDLGSATSALASGSASASHSRAPSSKAAAASPAPPHKPAAAAPTPPPKPASASPAPASRPGAAQTAPIGAQTSLAGLSSALRASSLQLVADLESAHRAALRLESAHRELARRSLDTKAAVGAGDLPKVLSQAARRMGDLFAGIREQDSGAAGGGPAGQGQGPGPGGVHHGTGAGPRGLLNRLWTVLAAAGKGTRVTTNQLRSAAGVPLLPPWESLGVPDALRGFIGPDPGAHAVGPSECDQATTRGVPYRPAPVPIDAAAAAPDSIRSQALTVLTAALVPTVDAAAAAAELEAWLWERARVARAGEPSTSGEGCAGTGGAEVEPPTRLYLATLRALWSRLSPTGPSFSPALREAILSGHVAPADVAAATGAELATIEGEVAERFGAAAGRAVAAQAQADGAASGSADRG